MQESTLIFDGECNLCNGIVGWLLRSAPQNKFKLVPFQSPKGQKLLNDLGFDTQYLASVILIDKTGVHTHSDGLLRIIAYIPLLSIIARLSAFVPKPLRDKLYNMITKNRIRWFGKSKSCRIAY
mgnify:CR=1 FL=1